VRDVVAEVRGRTSTWQVLTRILFPLVLPGVVFFVLLQRKLVTGMSAGAVKG
jgi:ABC-type glycerol-3-phosphate transport system permease component